MREGEGEGGEDHQQSTIIRSHSRRESDAAERSSFLSLDFLPWGEIAVNATFFRGFCFAFFLRIVWPLEVKKSKKYYFCKHLNVDKHSTL